MTLPLEQIKFTFSLEASITEGLFFLIVDIKMINDCTICCYLALPNLSDLLPLRAPARCLRSADANSLSTIRTKRRTRGDGAFSGAEPPLERALHWHESGSQSIIQTSPQDSPLQTLFLLLTPAPHPPLLESLSTGVFYIKYYYKRKHIVEIGRDLTDIKTMEYWSCDVYSRLTPQWFLVAFKAH